jgi:hypothetical protein
MTALVAAGVLLLGACGGDDDDAKSTDKKDDSSAEAVNGGNGADSGFCKDVVTLLTSTDTGSPEKAITAAKKLDPPAELADDWSTWIDGIESMSTTSPSFDPNDPELSGKYQDMYAATQKVFEYIQKECGMADLGPAGSTTTTAGQS